MSENPVHNDPQAKVLREMPTKLETLEEPVKAPKSPPAPAPIVSASTEDSLNARIEAIRRGGAA
jgi:hypothetical protein